MDQDNAYFTQKKEKARKLFDSTKQVFNPYLKESIILNSDGFHHLQFSARRWRNKKEQLLKFSLLPLALETIKRSGTLQEYREMMSPVGPTSKRDGRTVLKKVYYWGFVAILGEKRIKVKTILRRIGDGNIIFWSVMPYPSIKRTQRIFSGDVEYD